MSENSVPEDRGIDERQMVDRLARELYAIRYAPVPRTGNDDAVEAALGYRGSMQYEKLGSEERHVWKELARSVFEIMFGADRMEMYAKMLGTAGDGEEEDR